MSKIRDHLSDLRWRAANGRVKASNAWWRVAGRRIDGARQEASNRKNRRTIERGKAPRRDRVAAEVKSRTPIYRDRVNPAHGNKHREDARLHKSGNESLARQKEVLERVQPKGRDRANHVRAVASWDDPLPGERRKQRAAPARQPQGRTR